MKARTHTVYKGELDGQVVYIGTTIQKPEDRFRWHKANGKPFKFTVVRTFDNSQEMLAEEFRLIQKYKPKFNKIVHRQQNFNGKLSTDQVQERVGLAGWCQSCFKRRVNPGYAACRFCS
ncbi:GIY-YIG nuclease family protein [Pseudomonas vranovensis]|uniref:GIY-YIG nuclease family protein n=1 Tax=Pseudomonas vranovensis TaxID=321661 RepID=UPI003D99C0B4